jgi:hypothetical protein
MHSVVLFEPTEPSHFPSYKELPRGDIFCLVLGQNSSVACKILCFWFPCSSEEVWQKSYCFCQVLVSKALDQVMVDAHVDEGFQWFERKL